MVQVSLIASWYNGITPNFDFGNLRSTRGGAANIR